MYPIVQSELTQKDFRVELTQALGELDEIDEEAVAEGFRVPEKTTITNAKRLLARLYDVLPYRFEVYPMSDGEVAIDIPNGNGSSVMVLCDANGGALCSVNIKGNHRRARYSSTEMLPDGFVREALEDLESQSNST